MKINKTILAGFLACSMVLCSTPMVHATELTGESSESETVIFNEVGEETTLNVDVGIDKTLEIPLTLTAEKDEFYFCTNISPGDTMKAKVIFRNDSNTEDTQVAVTDVINQITDNAKAEDLLDILNLQISIDGTPIYKGAHSKVTTPVTGWINIPIGETVEMEIEIYFPKEADNRFQNAPMDVKWVFETRGDIPPDPEDEKTQTGDDSNHNFGIYFLGGAAICLAGGLLVVSKKKKKDEDK